MPVHDVPHNSTLAGPAPIRQRPSCASRRNACQKRGARWSRHRASRAGVLLGIVLVCIAVALMLGVALTRAVMLQHRNVTIIFQQQQSFWLAESGIGALVDQLRTSPAYRGETWEVPAEILGSDAPGIVVIHVDEATQPELGWQIRTEARYPNDPVHRVMCERDLFVAAGSLARNEGEP